MTRKYVILHEPAKPALTRGGPAAAPAGAEAPAARVETDELAPRAARALVANKKVAALAPAMPMKLIEPMVDAAAAADAWGIGAVGAAASPFDGSGIVVAVLDTGIDPAHLAFQGVELERRNFTTEAADDQHGHGTHCAGTIFGRDVGGQRIGVARGVNKAMIGKVLGAGGGSSDTIAQAIQWAVNGGAHVISMSLGIDFPGFVRELNEQEGLPIELATTIALEGYRSNVLLFERLASFVAARGLMAAPTLLVAAAGNESQRNVRPDFEVSVSPPAVADGIVSVAALGQGVGGFQVAPFSNTGARVSGPGVAVLSARRGGGLVTMSGTSMATPHVAGVAALWAQKLLAEGDLRLPLWTDRMIGAASKTGLKAGFDPTDIGAGMIQAPAS